MFKEVAVFVCFISAAVIAYDFKDSHYNEYLMQDLIDTVGDHKIYLPRLRHRRDADMEEETNCKPKKETSDFTKCCNDNANEAASEHFATYKGWKQQCAKEVRDSRNSEPVDVFSCDRINQTKEDLICISQCVGQKAQLIKEDGSVDEDGIIEHLKSNIIYSQWQKDVADEIAKKCLTEVKEVLASQPQNGKCSSASIKMGHCLWREFTLACPKDLQADTPKCNAIRSKLNSGTKYEFGSYHRYHSDEPVKDN